MYPRSFLCEEAKIKQRTPLKKELCEIGEEAIRECRFISFLFFNVFCSLFDIDCFLKFSILFIINCLHILLNAKTNLPKLFLKMQQ